ncbi:MAG: rhombosortase [Marinobacter sp.]|nr:rhombosortase [Marinobacter sp.]
MLAALLVVASLLPVTALEWSRTEIGGGEYWRLITGHGVHLGTAHLLLNLTGLLVISLLFTQHPPLAWWVSYLILAPLAISAGLLITAPELAWYRGFSGCLHGLLVFTALFNLGSDTRWSLIILGFIALKLLFENVLYPAAGHNPLIDGSVVTQAHWLGALTGLVAGILLLFRESSQRAIKE